MLKVGLTGGIGSGKSAASSQFEQLGVLVVDADVVAREVVQPGEPALARIAEHFGADILLPDGALNRARLREIIFSAPEQKTWLEQLLHPLIRERIIQQLERSRGPYAMLVSPLLLESGQAELVDAVIVVDVDETTQLARTTQRDGVDIDQVRRILATQMSRNDRLARADHVLDNRTDLVALKAQVETLHSELLQRAAQASR